MRLDDLLAILGMIHQLVVNSLRSFDVFFSPPLCPPVFSLFLFSCFLVFPLPACLAAKSARDLRRFLSCSPSPAFPRPRLRFRLRLPSLTCVNGFRILVLHSNVAPFPRGACPSLREVRPRSFHLSKNGKNGATAFDPREGREEARP